MTRPEKIALSASLLLLAGVVALAWLPGMPGNVAGGTEQGVGRAASTAGRSDAREPSRRIVPATVEERRARLEAIMDISSPADRRQALLEYLDAQPPALFPETLEIIGGQPGYSEWAGIGALEEEDLVLGAWVKANAPAALAYGLSKDDPFSQPQPLRYRMIEEWARMDLPAARVWVAQHLTGVRERSTALDCLIAGSAIDSPAEALKLALDSEDPAIRAANLKQLAHNVAFFPEAAEALLKDAGQDRDRLTWQIEMDRMTSTLFLDPVKALAMLEGKPEVAALIPPEYASNFLGMRSPEDLASFCERFHQSAPDELRDTFLVQALSRWLYSAPEDALPWLKEHPQPAAIRDRLPIR